MSSAQIELIKQLRDRTGAGLMDCKKAIVACENDVEKAIVWLREKGLSKVAKTVLQPKERAGLKSLVMMPLSSKSTPRLTLFLNHLLSVIWSKKLEKF